MSTVVIKSELILACRACLDTDVNLYNIHDDLLTEPFIQLTGTQVFVGDGLPQFLCMYCKTIVLKFIKFRSKVRTSQGVLVSALLQQGTITTYFIKNLNHKTHNLHPTLTIYNNNNKNTYKYDYEEETDKIVCNKLPTYKYTNDDSMDDDYDEDLIPLDKLKPEICDDDLNSDIIPVSKVRSSKKANKKVKKSIKKNTDVLVEDNTSTVFADVISDDITDKVVNDDNVIQGICEDTLFPDELIEIKDPIVNNEKKYESNKKSKVHKKSKSRIDTKKKVSLERKCKPMKESKSNKKDKKASSDHNKQNDDELDFWFEDEDKRLKFEKDYNMDVVILSKEKQIEDFEAKKLSSNYLESPFKCDVCYRGYMMEPAYKHHMLQHNTIDLMNRQRKVVCEICGVRFRFKCKLKVHSVSHKLRLHCKECDFVNSRKHRAVEHYKWHQGHKHECEYCGKPFRLKSNYYTHMRLQHPSEQVTCTVCGEGFHGQRGLLSHMRVHRVHDVLQKESAVHMCSSCNTQFTSTNALHTHIHTSENALCDPSMRSCSECGENYTNEELLKEHLEQHKNQYPCDSCDMSFPTLESRSTHYERIHLNVKKQDLLRSRLFRARYKELRTRSTQSDTARPQGVHMCEYCGKKFPSNSSMIYHQRTHTGEKPYECSACPKKFGNSTRLQLHFRTHTGEKPYQCKHCAKSFSSPSAHYTHQRVHTGEKPYMCPACGKCFSQSNTMKLHISTVHLKQPAPYKSRKRLQRQLEKLDRINMTETVS